MKEDYFEKKLAERLGGQEMTPPADLWQRIEASIDAASAVSTPVVINRRRRYISAAVGAASVAAVLLLTFLFVPERKDVLETVAEISMPADVSKQINVPEPILAEPEKILAENSGLNMGDVTTKGVIRKTRNNFMVMDPIYYVKSSEEQEDSSEGQDTLSNENTATYSDSNGNIKSKQRFNREAVNRRKSTKGVKLNISGSGNLGTSSSSSLKANVFASRIETLNGKPLLYESTPKDLDWKHSIPISVSASVQKMFTRRIGIETGLTYSYLSSRALVSSNPKVEVKQKLHYLGIPLSVVCNIGETGNFGFYAKGGFMVDKAISQDYRTYLENKSIKEEISTKGVQWSANLQLGASYKISNLVSLYLEPTMNYYFDSNQPVSYRTENNVGFSAVFGVRFNL